MKTVIFLGSHRDFSGLRLGAALGTFLTGKGDEVLLAGAKKDLPAYIELPTLALSATATVKTLTATLKKSGAQKIISLAHLPSCEAAAALNIPFVYVEPENLKESKPFKNKKALLAKAVRVFVLGTNPKPLDKKRYGANAVRVKNPAIWVEHYNYNKPACFKKENNIVAAGNLTKDGGFDVLLATWARLAPAHKTWHLTIVGDGTQKAALKKLITKHHLEPSTELVPAGTDLYSLLRNADIYVSAARAAEGLNELLDAMASKLPVVATDVPGVAELVANGISGLIVNPGEEEPLTVALDELMVNWGKRVGMALEASKHKERFSFEEFANLVTK
ncbi:MAG: glycosyltransferase [Elusimicrobiaceae bacterium]|nr:glycosyltransferase [Elusimicrobiaceae bacterium]